MMLQMVLAAPQPRESPDESTRKSFRRALITLSCAVRLFWRGYPVRCHAAKSEG